MSRSILPALPLIYDGDSYFIYLVPVGSKLLRITAIHRFRNNQNTDGTEESFRDLQLDTRRAIIRQINRRHPGKTIQL